MFIFLGDLNNQYNLFVARQSSIKMLYLIIKRVIHEQARKLLKSISNKNKNNINSNEYMNKTHKTSFIITLLTRDLPKGS